MGRQRDLRTHVRAEEAMAERDREEREKKTKLSKTGGRRTSKQQQRNEQTDEGRRRDLVGNEQARHRQPVRGVELAPASQHLAALAQDGALSRTVMCHLTISDTVAIAIAIITTTVMVPVKEEQRVG